MRIRLADVGDPLSLPMIGMRRDARARSLRLASGEGSGGGSADDTTEEEGSEDEDSEDENDENASEGSEKETDGKGKPSELDKAIRRRNTALARARKAEEERDKLRAQIENKDGDKPDPVEVANQRLIRQSFRTQLAALGITEKEDQRAVLDVIRLDGITVDDDGADEDEIEDRISELRRIFTGAAPRQTRRTPRVDTRDRGGSGGEQTDPDAARYKRILTGRGRRG